MNYQIIINLTNCICDYNLDYIVENEFYTITLTANDNCFFPKHSCKFINSDGATSYMNITNNGRNAICEFVANGKQTIIGNALYLTDNKYNYISIYKPTIEQVDTLLKQQYIEGRNGNILNLNDYIIKLNKCYYNFESVGSENIYLGEFNSNIYCQKIDNSIKIIDFGSVFIPELYQNSLDYESKLSIYLPFIGVISLDIRFMNKSVNLIYKTNPINGDTIALLYENGNEFELGKCNIYFQTPIKYNNSSIYILNYIENPMFIMDKTPYIEIITNEMFGVNPNYGYDNNMWFKLSDCHGYIQCSELDLRLLNNVSSDIFNEIYKCLIEGVIF